MNKNISIELLAFILYFHSTTCRAFALHNRWQKKASTAPQLIACYMKPEHESTTPYPQSESSNTSSFVLNNDDLTSEILSFVGTGTYRFSAGVNRHFRNNYRRSSSPNDQRTFYSAAVSSIPCSEMYLMESNSSNKMQQLCFAAARHGQLSVLKQYATKQYFTPWMAATAAGNGHLDVLQWLYESGCPWNEETCAAAASRGNLKILQWTRNRGCPWDKMTLSLAARNGHMKVLEWAKKNGCPWDESATTMAAESGRLQVLEWLWENGCPWDEDTCAAAAAHGHLEIIQWARSKGCPWDETTCLRAAVRGKVDVLLWARGNGCPWNHQKCYQLSSHPAVRRWIENSLQPE